MRWRWRLERVVCLRIITGSEMKKIDLWAQTEKKIPPLLLMENAGRSVALAIQNLYRDKEKGNFVFSGKGSNGGDALVAAVIFISRELTLRSFFFSGRRLARSCTQNWELLKI